MASNVDAVIAALKVALHEAERSHNSTYWKVREANRWISQLPGAWYGRWNNLTVKSPYSDGDTSRTDFIIQLRATLAYLEAHRDLVNSSPFSFSRAKLKPTSAAVNEPVDADFEDVPGKLHTLPVPRGRNRTSK